MRIQRYQCKSWGGPGQRNHKEIIWKVVKIGGVAERVWRFYRRRLRLLQCFMREGGADSFLDLYELYLNFHGYQIRA